MENLIISNGVKKIILLICLFFLLLTFLVPITANAALVPCGLRSDNPDTDINEVCLCTLCHFFILFKNVIDFLVTKLVPVVAVLMLVIGGVIFLTAGANPNNIEKAKKLITNAILGLVIIFAAWLIVNTFLMAIGVQDWTNLRNWWKIEECEVPNSSNDSDNNCIVD